MSGIEALQGVASIIQLTETTIRIISRIIEYSDRAASVPKALEPTVHCLPLLCDCVEKLRDRPICQLPNVHRVLSGIKTTIVELEKEIKNILPLETDSGLKRIGKGLKSLKTEGKIERLENALGKYQAALGFYIQISEVARRRTVSPKYGGAASPKLGPGQEVVRKRSPMRIVVNERPGLGEPFALEDHEARRTERDERFKKNKQAAREDEVEELKETFDFDSMSNIRYGTRTDSQQPTVSLDLIDYSDEDDGIIIDGVSEPKQPVSSAAPGGVSRGWGRPAKHIVKEVSKIGTILAVIREMLRQIFEDVKEVHLTTESSGELRALLKDIDQKVGRVKLAIFDTNPSREEVALNKLLALGEMLSYLKAIVETLLKKSKQAERETSSLAGLVGLGPPGGKAASQKAREQIKPLMKQYKRILATLDDVQGKFEPTIMVKVRVAAS